MRVSDLQQMLAFSGWRLRAGRRDGLSWASIERGGETLTTESTVDLVAAVEHLLVVAAARQASVRGALGHN